MSESQVESASTSTVQDEEFLSNSSNGGKKNTPKQDNEWTQVPHQKKNRGPKKPAEENENDAEETRVSPKARQNRGQQETGRPERQERTERTDTRATSHTQNSQNTQNRQPRGRGQPGFEYEGDQNHQNHEDRPRQPHPAARMNAALMASKDTIIESKDGVISALRQVIEAKDARIAELEAKLKR